MEETQSSVAMEMPRYKCHKEVHALKIAEIINHAPGEDGQWPEGVEYAGAHLMPEDKMFAPIPVDADWMKKHNPQPGGYLVVYKDGYKSYSPAEAFEDGYAPAGGKCATIARICHEVNRAYCNALGDNSQPSWEEAPEWQKQSAISGVAGIMLGDITKPSESHESWLAEKEATGWKYGPVKDPEKKEHPCFVPYEELPAEQRMKDHLFFAVVNALNVLPQL